MPLDQTPEAGKPESSKGCGCGAGNAAMPKVTFSTFVLSLCSSALVQLGEVPEPETGATAQDLVMAKHTIDVLAMLKEKTSQCLDPEESRLLNEILYELRIKYVNLSS